METCSKLISWFLSFLAHKRGFNNVLRFRDRMVKFNFSNLELKEINLIDIVLLWLTFYIDLEYIFLANQAQNYVRTITFINVEMSLNQFRLLLHKWRIRFLFPVARHFKHRVVPLLL